MDQFPAFLRKDVGSDGVLNVYQNGEATYTLKGVHAKVSILWNYEAPPGAKDSHYSLLRGTKATLSIKQRAEENYVTTLYVENTANAPAEQFERTLRAAIGRLTTTWPGLDVKKAGSSWVVVVPEKYRVGHEAHFGQVTANFLRFLAEGRLPAWEVPNMLAKYYTATEAYRLSLKTAAAKP